MRSPAVPVALAATAVRAQSSSLADLCTVSNVRAALPSNGTLLGIDLLPSTLTASPIYNATVGGGMNGGVASGSSSSATYNYCNVTVSYAHTGKPSDVVSLIYGLPSPSDFASRFYVSGGGGFSLGTDATGGLPYGAASGATDAGYGALDGTSYDAVALYGNGSVNWDAAHMFGYQALGEMTVVGKALSRALYGLGDEGKVYTYFEGCSDGGREGMSQVQRYGGEYDGVVAGAPAFRFAQQQVLHLHPGVVETTAVGYAPPQCEMDKIVNATIAACDGLDGREDGVVSRTDLCMLEFDLKSLVGTPYSCAESGSVSGGSLRRRQMPGSGTSYAPAQNGTITKEGVAVAQAVYDGVFDAEGRRGYLSWQVASKLSDAATSWNTDTESWEAQVVSMGGEYVARFVQLLELDNLSSLEGVTGDTLIGWMQTGMTRFYDSLQTTQTDLTEFQEAGGKLLHYHGESDSSIPSASSVHYWQAVRDIMYPGAKSHSDAENMMADWYQLYLVPGAEHCGANSLQPGPYPSSNMDTIIAWAEQGVAPQGLNATTDSGDYEGEKQVLCQFPKRPLWRDGEDAFDCVGDAASIETWTYDFDAFKVPVA